jgi:RimJ/RimL family protein N-acetyltransferase
VHGATPIRLRPDVSLARITPVCAERMLRWVSDSHVAENLGLRARPSRERTLTWIARAATDTDMLARAIILAGEHVGNIVFDCWDTHLGTTRLSIYIGESTARGQGIGLTAIYLGLQEAFRRADTFKVWLTVHEENHAAVRTYGRLGFQSEGVLRGEFLKGGQRLNAIYMGLVRAEFERLQPVGAGAQRGDE